MTNLVYFDHNATTPIDARVLEEMLPYFTNQYGNASSRHEFGTIARKAINQAREQVAAAVGVQASQVIFVSGGTEANNLFVKGAAAYLKPSQIVVSAIEHPCVAKPAQELVRQGWMLHKLKVNAQGSVEMSDLDLALQKPTGLVSVMLANNETGVIQDVQAIAKRAQGSDTLMHTDAVQALGKIPVDFQSLSVNAMTISGHKIYGPKGAAALIVDKKLALKPIISGGGHEQGLRSGTENVASIVGFGKACEIAVSELTTRSKHLAQLREQLEIELLKYGAILFGAGAQRVPNTSYFAFPDVDGETLVIELDKAGYAVASGAACSSTSTEPSATLLAMGVEPTLARGAVRVSFGKDNTQGQVTAFIQVLGEILNRFYRMAAIAVQS